MNNQTKTMQSLWVGLGSLSSFLMTIVSAIILARVLTKSDFGTYRQILYVYTSLLVVFSAGIPKTYSYFMPRFGLSKQKDVVKKITIILLFLGLFFSIALYFFAPIISSLLKNPKLIEGLRAFSPIPFLLLPTLGIEGVYSTLKKTEYFAMYQVISRIIQLLSITIPVLYFGGTYKEAIHGWVISSFILLILGLYFKKRPFLSVDIENSRIKYNDIFNYSLPIMFASIFGIGAIAADQFFISRYFGEEVFAVFASGKLELPFVTMVTASVATVLAPIFSKLAFDGNKKEEIKDLWKSSLIKSGVIIYPIVLYFLFFATDIFISLYGEPYTESATYFRIYSLISFFNVIIFAPLILGLGLVKFYARLHFFAFISVWTLEYLVIIFYHSPYAIAIVSTAITILKILFALWYVSKKLEIPYFEMLPIKSLFKYLLHGIGILIVIKFILGAILIVENHFFILSISFIMYVFALLFTSRFFKINYLRSFIPFIERKPKLNLFLKKYRLI